MGWQRPWGPCPGRGPWSHLPPYMRPGWWFRGRGWCWWWCWGYPYPPWHSKEEEVRYLEDLKKYISDVLLREIDKRLEELKGK